MKMLIQCFCNDWERKWQKIAVILPKIKLVVLPKTKNFIFGKITAILLLYYAYITFCCLSYIETQNIQSCMFLIKKF